MTKATLVVVAVLIATPSCGEPQGQPSVPGPVSLHGTGPTTTEAITLPAYVSVVAMSYAGRGKFAVDVLTDRWYGGRQEQFLEHIGPYKGRRVLKVGSPVRLNIQSDGGDWTVTISAIECCGNPSGFSGAGDDVSKEFNWRDSFPSNWEFAHDGVGNFMVRLHFPGGGSRTITNNLGRGNGQAIVTCGESLISTGGGNCFWEVQADGNWTIRRV